MIDSICSIVLMVSLAFCGSTFFYGIFRKCEDQINITWYKFFGTISFALLQSSCFNFYVHFRSICLTPFSQIPSLIRYAKVRIVVSKVHNLIWPVRRKVVLLVHCIVPTVPISPQKPKMI